MKNIEFKERFVPLNIIKYLIKEKEEIEQKLNNYPILYCNICGDTNRYLKYIQTYTLSL